MLKKFSLKKQKLNSTNNAQHYSSSMYKLCSTLGVMILLGIASNVYAHQYWTYADGTFVRDDQDMCIKSHTWTPADAIPECEKRAKRPHPNTVAQLTSQLPLPTAKPVSRENDQFVTFFIEEMSLRNSALFESAGAVVSIEHVRHTIVHEG